jgi:hypothetical protein
MRSQLGQAKQALAIFNRIEQQGIIALERIRIDVLNQQSKTAIASGDLEQGSAYVEAGGTGAKSLSQ